MCWLITRGLLEARSVRHHLHAHAHQSPCFQNAYCHSRTLFFVTSFLQVRRSLFGNDSDRRRFLMLIMSGVCDILRAKEGLSSLECYQNFCRLLGRLKANYQLSELVRTEGYEEWLKLAAEFAVHSFSQMHVRGGAHDCVHVADHGLYVPYSRGTFRRCHHPAQPSQLIWCRRLKLCLFAVSATVATLPPIPRTTTHLPPLLSSLSDSIRCAVSVP